MPSIQLFYHLYRYAIYSVNMDSDGKTKQQDLYYSKT
jgi:hypothetical protein